MSAEPEQSLVLPEPSTEGASAIQQAGEVLLTFLSETGLGTRHQRGQVLGELARHARRADSASQPLLPTAYLKQAVAPRSTKEPSAWMSQEWRKLLQEEPSWQIGLQQIARRLGKDHLPKLIRIDGSSAMYGIQTTPVRCAATDEADESVDLPAGGVRYATEQVTEPAAWLRWWMRGGRARWSLLPRLAVVGWVLGGMLVVMLLMLAVYARAASTRGPVTFGDLWMLVMLCAIGWLVWQEERYVSTLFDLRIVMAPAFVTRFADQGVTLELRRAENEEDSSQLVLSKYTAACPLCTGTVGITDGRRAFPDRLVGRCSRSPREHVFSFDQARRVGVPLH
jgi:hypothetical protein